jgi:hypothetical protein
VADLFTINEETCRTPSFFGELEYDSIKLITKDNNRFVFSEFKFKNITPKSKGCCNCPLYELT